MPSYDASLPNPYYEAPSGNRNKKILIIVLIIVVIIVIGLLIWAIVYASNSNEQSGLFDGGNRKLAPPPKPKDNFDLEPDDISGNSVEMELPPNGNQGPQGEINNPSDIIAMPVTEQQTEQNGTQVVGQIAAKRAGHLDSVDEIYFTAHDESKTHSLISADDKKSPKLFKTIPKKNKDLYNKGFKPVNPKNPHSETYHKKSYTSYSPKSN